MTIELDLARDHRHILWFHCPSQVSSFLDKLREENPECRVVALKNGEWNHRNRWIVGSLKIFASTRGVRILA